MSTPRDYDSETWRALYPDAADHNVVCNQCSTRMRLCVGPYGLFYGCPTRGCDGKVGALADGWPKGPQVSGAVRKARQNAHRHLDRLWRKSAQPKRARVRVYAWLAKELGVTAFHTADMDEAGCARVIELCKDKDPFP